MRPRGLRTLAVLVSLLLVLASACLLPRYDAVLAREAAYDDERIAERLDPWLLVDGPASKLVVEVDWVAGCRPGPRTIVGLEKVLEKYGPPGRPIVVVWSDEISRELWDEQIAHEKDRAVQRLVERFASASSTAEIEHRYVLFAPSAGGYFGYSTAWTIIREDQGKVIRGVVVARDKHERYAKLWISLDKLERMTLIHEFGHQFGLVSDPRHERVQSAHRGHCTRLDCPMAHPTPRVIARNLVPGLVGIFFRDDCEQCQAELRTAQAVWQRRQEADPLWHEKIKKKREETLAVTAIANLLYEERYDEVLRKIEKAGAVFPHSPSLASLRIRALIGLGNIERALEQWDRRPDRNSDTSAHAWTRRDLAEALIECGHHARTYGLMEPLLRDDQDDYLFEQMTYVARKALEGCGRFSEAADLVLRLLARGHSISFFEEGMQQQAATFLRRAGRLDEADVVFQTLLRSKQRSMHLSEAARLRRAQGRLEDARSFLREALVDFDEKLKTTAERDRAFLIYRRAEVLARLDRVSEARQALAQSIAGTSDLSDSDIVWLSVLRARAYAALGDFDAALQIWKGMGPPFKTGDPCAEESLSSVRDQPANAELFSCCRPLASAVSPDAQKNTPLATESSSSPSLSGPNSDAPAVLSTAGVPWSART